MKPPEATSAEVIDCPKPETTRRAGERWLFPSIRNPERNQLIDVLRGLSILMVLLSHLPMLDLVWEQIPFKVFGRPPSDITLGMGYYGVSLFFVISGFLITSVTLRRHETLSKIDCSAFWWMRFSRIMPMLLTCLFAMALFHFWEVPGFHFTSSAQLWRNISAVLSFRFPDVLGASANEIAWNPLWSLSVEEMFYLAFPFACLAINGLGSAVWLSLVVMATAVYMRFAGQASPYSTLGCMDLLALGCFVALLRPERLREKLSRRSSLALGAGCGVLGLGLIAFVVLYQHPIPKYQWSSLPCGLGMALALVATQLLSVPGWLRYGLMPLSIFGVVSYELYLVHLPLKALTVSVFRHNSPLLVLTAVILAILAHECFSEPMNKTLRLLVRGPAEAAARRVAWLRCAALSLLAVVSIATAGWLGLSFSRTTVTSFCLQEVAVLPAGVLEPLVYMGQSGAADLVYLRHEADGSLRFGIDHWGHPSTVGESLTPTDLAGKVIRVSMGKEGVQVSVDGKILAKNATPIHLKSAVRLGLNDIGFSVTQPKAVSRILCKD